MGSFVEGLGPGQLVGRQALASPNLGDIQLSICDRKGNIEVEVIRARSLQTKPGAKSLPGKKVSVTISFSFRLALVTRDAHQCVATNVRRVFFPFVLIDSTLR